MAVDHVNTSLIDQSMAEPCLPRRNGVSPVLPPVDGGDDDIALFLHSLYPVPNTLDRFSGEIGEEIHPRPDISCGPDIRHAARFRDKREHDNSSPSSEVDDRRSSRLIPV